MRVQTKICGTTSPGDARLAQDAGADFLGVILRHPASPRHVSLAMARQIRESVSLSIVALGVNQSLESWLEIADALHPTALQLHGDEAPELVAALAARGFAVWKAIAGDENQLLAQARTFSEAGAAALVVDAREIAPHGIIYGGTGHLADWNGARRLVEANFRVFLAGGLDPDNVARAVEAVQPWGVDVVSGVEAAKGSKDAAKVRLFVARARASALALD